MTKLIEVPIDQIEVPEDQIRSVITKEGLEELQDSIKRTGLIHPPIVVQKDEKFILISGYRRFLACRNLGWIKIPVLIRKLNAKQKYQVVVDENFRRENVNYIDLAKYLKYLNEEEGYSKVELAEMFGYSPGWLNMIMKVLKVDEPLQAAVEAGHIDVTSALELQRLPTPLKRKEYLQYAVEGGATQSLIRRWVADELGRTASSKATPSDTTPISTPKPPPMPTGLTCHWCRKEFNANMLTSMSFCIECRRTLEKALRQTPADEDTT